MAAVDLPCDGDGICMRCKSGLLEPEMLLCRTCATPWHVSCLSKPPETMASVVDWQCPDCSLEGEKVTGSASAACGVSGELIAAIRAIEADLSLTEEEKARRRQRLMSGGAGEEDDEEEKGRTKEKGKVQDDVLYLFDEKLKCSFCMQLPERPVSTPCGHNFCLKCFQKWVAQGKHSCVKCRAPIPSKMASQPRINSVLVAAIRMAKTAKSVISDVPTHVYHFPRNEGRPEKAFTTERAKRAGKANACSGQIFVTVPPDHFGPILAENDPKRNRGVLVGDLWEDRMECRQWGAHLPHVAGIAGQSEYGAQSVALSGGYADDEDHGEWFLYTGSGGRDLTGNKRTNKDQAFDQKFEKYNEALRVSCKNGYPVRVVRSHKEKSSSYAPETGVRYDGIYRIEKCWRKVGIQGFKVCRYLFVRCDNEPAPWTSDENGDRPRPLPAIEELKNAIDITERKESPAWDFDTEHGWKWMKPPPVSRKAVITAKPEDRKMARKAIRLAQINCMTERLFKEFGCTICHNIITSPLTTPCGHNFCKSCLLDSFSDKSFIRERTRADGRALRAQKIVKKCPSCPFDISDFLQNPRVNVEMMDLIEAMVKQADEENERLEKLRAGGSDTVKVSTEAAYGFEQGKPSSNGSDNVDDTSGKICDKGRGNDAEAFSLGSGSGNENDGDNDATNNNRSPSRKRKNSNAGWGAGKSAKKSEEVGNVASEASNKEIPNDMKAKSNDSKASDGSAEGGNENATNDSHNPSRKRKNDNAGLVAGRKGKKNEEVGNTAVEMWNEEATNESKAKCDDGAVKPVASQMGSKDGGDEEHAQNLDEGVKPRGSVRYKRVVASRLRAGKNEKETTNDVNASLSSPLHVEADDDGDDFQ